MNSEIRLSHRWVAEGKRILCKFKSAGGIHYGNLVAVAQTKAIAKAIVENHNREIE